MYSTPLYFSALVLEWLHGICNKYDRGEGSTTSKGYVRPQVVLIFLVVCGGIDRDSTLRMTKSLQICEWYELVSEDFLKDGNSYHYSLNKCLN